MSKQRILHGKPKKKENQTTKKKMANTQRKYSAESPCQCDHCAVNDKHFDIQIISLMEISLMGGIRHAFCDLFSHISNKEKRKLNSKTYDCIEICYYCNLCENEGFYTLMDKFKQIQCKQNPNPNSNSSCCESITKNSDSNLYFMQDFKIADEKKDSTYTNHNEYNNNNNNNKNKNTNKKFLKICEKHAKHTKITPIEMKKKCVINRWYYGDNCFKHIKKSMIVEGKSPLTIMDIWNIYKCETKFSKMQCKNVKNKNDIYVTFAEKLYQSIKKQWIINERCCHSIT